jgi:hypothetical protein
MFSTEDASSTLVQVSPFKTSSNSDLLNLLKSAPAVTTSLTNSSGPKAEIFFGIAEIYASSIAQAMLEDADS